MFRQIWLTEKSLTPNPFDQSDAQAMRRGFAVLPQVERRSSNYFSAPNIIGCRKAAASALCGVIPKYSMVLAID